jgi:two-component system nitrogen regulation response regulator NtrX
VEVNCAAIPEELIESELFGHTKGAFTGALAARKGKFELADGGTLFLDEVGDMTLKTQAKVLRALQEQKVEPVGGASSVTVDVRVIAATNKHLEDEIRKGAFREDLYFRLNVVPVEIPPLRERTADIAVLAEHFVQRFCRELGRPAVKLDPAALATLKSYGWPGNVRELKNVIERVVLLEADDEILPEHLPAEMTRTPGGASAPSRDAFPSGQVRPFTEIEKMAIEHALGVCDGNKTRAATLLGISRQTLRTKLKEYALGDDAEETDGGA